MNANYKKWARVAAKAKEEVTEHKKLIEELRTDALEKEIGRASCRERVFLSV